LPGWGCTLSSERSELLDEISVGLRRPQKELPSKLFYDERGSELFEEITDLPEYYLTRAEQGLLHEHIPGWVEKQRPHSLVELGAGSATKTRIVLDAMHANEVGEVYVPVDISADFLERTAAELRREHPDMTVIPLAADFTRSFTLPPSLPHPALLTFLGSTIGNLTSTAAVDLLRRARSEMHSEDRFLLGLDLRKDVRVLEAAYNDARGVTAEFNLNVLRVINRRFGANFDLSTFRHRAIYNARDFQMEMHLVSTRLQTVSIPHVGEVELREGETIRTEVSRKYDRLSVASLFTAAGLTVAKWQEDAEGLFALTLASRISKTGGMPSNQQRG